MHDRHCARPNRYADKNAALKKFTEFFTAKNNDYQVSSQNGEVSLNVVRLDDAKVQALSQLNLSGQAPGGGVKQLGELDGIRATSSPVLPKISPKPRPGKPSTPSAEVKSWSKAWAR
ncbi:hypothetical protein ACYZT2_18800 [Pseudomonas sp. MDT1-85]